MPVVAVLAPVLLALMLGMRRLGGLEADTARALKSLEKSIDKLEAGLASLAKIPELERRVAQLEESLRSVSNALGSMREFKGITREQIKAHEEQIREARRSSSDLSAHMPTIPRTDPHE